MKSLYECLPAYLGGANLRCVSSIVDSLFASFEEKTNIISQLLRIDGVYFCENNRIIIYSQTNIQKITAYNESDEVIYNETDIDHHILFVELAETPYLVTVQTENEYYESNNTESTDHINALASLCGINRATAEIDSAYFQRVLYFIDNLSEISLPLLMIQTIFPGATLSFRSLDRTQSIPSYLNNVLNSGNTGVYVDYEDSGEVLKLIRKYYPCTREYVLIRNIITQLQFLSMNDDYYPTLTPYSNYAWVIIELVDTVFGEKINNAHIELWVDGVLAKTEYTNINSECVFNLAGLISGSHIIEAKYNGYEEISASSVVDSFFNMNNELYFHSAAWTVTNGNVIFNYEDMVLNQSAVTTAFDVDLMRLSGIGYNLTLDMVCDNGTALDYSFMGASGSFNGSELCFDVLNDYMYVSQDGIVTNIISIESLQGLQELQLSNTSHGNVTISGSAGNAPIYVASTVTYIPVGSYLVDMVLSRVEREFGSISIVIDVNEASDATIPVAGGASGNVVHFQLDDSASITFPNLNYDTFSYDQENQRIILQVPSSEVNNLNIVNNNLILQNTYQNGSTTGTWTLQKDITQIKHDVTVSVADVTVTKGDTAEIVVNVSDEYDNPIDGTVTVEITPVTEEEENET